MNPEKTFIEKLVARYREQEKGKGPDLLIFPNRRALNAFKNQLLTESAHAILLPSLETIESYSAQVSGYRQLSKREMLVPLYDLIKTESSNGGFRQFLNWAPTLIDDFNDIDDYLAVGKELFEYLGKLKAIELWNPGGSGLSDFQKRFMEFWETLPELYRRVKEFNESAQCGTAGQVKRKAAEVLSERKGFMSKRTWFAGFNALTPSEAMLVDILADRGMVRIFWDAGVYYYENRDHEAGKYIHDYHERWEKLGVSELILHQGWEHPDKKIRICGAPGLGGQALAAATALIEMRQKHPEKRVAIIAAGMQAEQALAYYLPEGEQINYSPGLSFTLTPAAGFIQLAWELWLRQDPGKGFPSADLCALLRNPLVSEFGEHTSKKLLHQLIESGKTYIGNAELKDVPDEPFFVWLKSFVYGKKISTRAWASSLRELLMNFYKDHYAKSPFEKRSIATGLGITAIDHFLKETEGLPEVELDPHLGKRWMQQNIRELKIPVKGEPHSGVQVMGLLESRNLDFELVILVGANEGQLPAPAQPSSFIPFDIRREFKLPGRSDRESVFAYHFYRMLQHPEEAVLIYNTEIDSFGSGEKSRYLQQLEFEWPQKVKGAKLSHEVRKNVPIKDEERDISASKTEKALSAIREKLKYGLSPTALNSYRNCGLQFYLRYILRLQEAEEQSSLLGADTLGTGIHFALEEIYGKNLNQVLREQDLIEAKKNSKILVTDGLRKAFKHADLSAGKNLLLAEMSETLVKKILDFDIERLEAGKQVMIEAVEAGLETEMMIAGERVKFHGKADRIEKVEGSITVVDYKTGKAEKKDVEIAHVRVFEEESKEKAFQLMMYRWMYEKMNEGNTARAGILSVRKPSDGILYLNIKDDKNSIALFEDYLKNLVSGLLSAENTFTKTADYERCGYCEFARMCGRM